MNLFTGPKRVLITGASGLLGGALIDQADPDWDVVAMVHRTPINSTSAQTRVFDVDSADHVTRSVRTIQCDLADPNAIGRAVDQILALVGFVNYVVNGAADTRFLGSTTDIVSHHEAAQRQLFVNAIAPAVLCSELFHKCWKQRPLSEPVSIVNVSSISGSVVFDGRGQAVYAASKAAFNMMTMHSARDFDRYNIKLNCASINAFSSKDQTRALAAQLYCLMLSGLTGKIVQLK